MTYEHNSGSGYPAEPDIDVGLPGVCEACNVFDCFEPCAAFDRVVEHLNYLREHLENIFSEITTAKNLYKKERKWWGDDADRGYLDSVRDEALKTKGQISLLETILGMVSE